MWARVTHMLVDRERRAEFERVLIDEAMPNLPRQAGFVNWLALERDDGAWTVISLWADRASAEASEQSGFYIDQVARLRPFLLGPAQRESCPAVGGE